MHSAPPPRLLDRVRQAARLRHMSRRTEEAEPGALSAAGAPLALSSCLFLFPDAA